MRAWAIGVVVGAAAVPGGAAAAPVPHHVTETVVGGPVLTAEGPVWAEGSPYTIIKAVRLTSPGGPLAQTDLGARGAVAAFTAKGLAVAGGRVFAAVQRAQPDNEDGNLVQGSALLSGPSFTAVSGTTSVDHHLTHLDGSGDLLIAGVADGFGNDSGLELRDVAGGAPPRPVGPARASDGRVAGLFVSWISPDFKTIVVADAATGAERYRLTPGVLDFEYDLQDDGTIVVQMGGQLAWASLADPRLHPFATGAAPVVRYRDQAIDDPPAVLRIVAGGQVLYRTAHDTLALVALSGTAPPRVLTTDPPGQIIGADLDGTSLTWATRECVYTDTLGAAPPAAPPFGTCRTLALVLSVNRFRTWHGAVKTHVACGDVPCTGTETLRTVRDGRRPPRTVATKAFKIPAGVTKTINIPVARGRGRRGVGVVATVTARDPGGLAAHTIRPAGFVTG